MIGLKKKVTFLNLEVFFLCLKSQNEECLGRGQGHCHVVFESVGLEIGLWFVAVLGQGYG